MKNKKENPEIFHRFNSVKSAMQYAKKKSKEYDSTVYIHRYGSTYFADTEDTKDGEELICWYVNGIINFI